MALLVYDMQVGNCSQIKSGSEIVTRISRLLAVARATGMRVAFTSHLSLPKAWMGATQFRMAMAWQQKDEPDAVAPWFLRDAPGFQIASELSPMPDEAVFDKITMSALPKNASRSAARLWNPVSRHRRDRARLGSANRPPRRGPVLHSNGHR
jgi:nicotinamidase-related amidase